MDARVPYLPPDTCIQHFDFLPGPPETLFSGRPRESREAHSAKTGKGIFQAPDAFTSVSIDGLGKVVGWPKT